MEADELTSPRGFEIEARGLTYKIVHRRQSLSNLITSRGDHTSDVVEARPILDNVSIRAKPFELLALVGPSGAGKSTLLQILTARLPIPATSPPALFLNRAPLLRPSALLKLTAFVPQHDSLFPLLTVRETLLFTARLRIPDLPSHLLHSRVNSLLAELGLDSVANTRVGDGVRHRGLSGGERRRLSIAVEVVHDPGMVVLDEPTSGLDSSSALQIVKVLRGMAEGRGRTIVMSIHQPGLRIVKLLSGVVVMAAGRVVHQGSVEALERRLRDVGMEPPLHVNVVEYAVECVEELAKVAGKGKGNGRCTLGELFEGKEGVAAVLAGGVGSGNWWVVETAILTHRYVTGILLSYWKTVMRTKELFLCRTIQMLISGLVLGSIFYHLPAGLTGAEERVGLFAFTLTFLLSSTTEALPIFLQERQILIKETSSGTYRLSAYTAANALVFLPFLLILALLFSVPVYWLVRLNSTLSSFAYFTLLIWLILYTANSVVVCVASIAPDFIVGNSLINGMLGAFFLFSGYFIRKEAMPSYWVFMHYISLFKYPFEGFLVNEFRDKCLEESGGVCLWKGGDVLREVGLGEESRWRNVGVMVGLIMLYRLLGYVFLSCRLRCVRKGGLKRALVGSS